MTGQHARSMQILLGLALAACLLAGCGRRNAPVTINTPEPVALPAARTAVGAEVIQPTRTSVSTPAPAASSTVRPTSIRPTSTPTSSFVPTVIASVEKTVTVGAEMVDCTGEGAGSGKCYLVQEEGATEWTVFPGRIEGFEFWPGAEYVIVIREDQISNPPPGGSDVVWTIVKGLFQINVPRTPTTEP
jgi:hypothetical protein